MMGKHCPTPYPDVNEVLNLLLEEAQDVLGNNWVGLYLYGSLSSGDFDPASSDIDFLIVTTDLLDEKTITDLETMHKRIWDTGLKWAFKLEGSYLPQDHLPRYEKSGIAYPTVNEGKFYLAPHDSDWIIQRHIIREQGISLSGPDSKALIDPVSPKEIRRAVKGFLDDWWFPMLEDLPWLENRGSHYHAYAILTMCRSLHALEHGTIVSKLEAAKWAQQEFAGRWQPAIVQALAMQSGQGESDLFDEAVAFIRFTLERVRFAGINNDHLP
jgi:hypothetical protein